MEVEESVGIWEEVETDNGIIIGAGRTMLQKEKLEETKLNEEEDLKNWKGKVSSWKWTSR